MVSNSCNKLFANLSFRTSSQMVRLVAELFFSMWTKWIIMSSKWKPKTMLKPPNHYRVIEFFLQPKFAYNFSAHLNEIWSTQQAIYFYTKEIGSLNLWSREDVEWNINQFTDDFNLKLLQLWTKKNSNIISELLAVTSKFSKDSNESKKKVNDYSTVQATNK